MKPVVLESPYAGDVSENVAYAGLVTLALAGRGLVAYASHLHLTTFLDDRVPVQRDIGIELGLQLASAMDAAVFALDRGWSRGMDGAWKRHKAADVPMMYASVGLVYDGTSWASTLARWKVAISLDPRVLQQLGLAMELRPLESRPLVN